MLTNSSSHGNGQASSTWILDSGASFHVTGESQHIKLFAHFDGPDQIFIGNGEGLHISSTGSSSFVSPYGFHITFNTLLHVLAFLFPVDHHYHLSMSFSIGLFDLTFLCRQC